MDKNTELLLQIFFLQRDHMIGFRANQLVGIIYSVLCELKFQGFKHEYTYTFKRFQNPNSAELTEILKELVAGKYLEQARNQKGETVYKLGVKGALLGKKLTAVDPAVQNCLMAWIGYFLPLNNSSVDRHLYDRCKVNSLEIGDSIPLTNPFIQKRRYEDFDDAF